VGEEVGGGGRRWREMEKKKIEKKRN